MGFLDFILIGQREPWKVAEHGVNKIMFMCVGVYMFLRQLWWFAGGYFWGFRMVRLGTWAKTRRGEENCSLSQSPAVFLVCLL